MKLWEDFGVRALLAVVAGLGFYAMIGYILVNYELDLSTIIAIVGLANSPWLLALGFYFGTQVNKPKTGGE